MQTNDLIARLSANLQPAPAGAVLKRIGIALVAGAAVAPTGLLLAVGTDLSMRSTRASSG